MPITMKTLRDSGVVSKQIKHGIKLLGKGKALSTPVEIEVSRASQSAIQVRSGAIPFVLSLESKSILSCA